LHSKIIFFNGKIKQLIFTAIITLIVSLSSFGKSPYWEWGNGSQRGDESYNVAFRQNIMLITNSNVGYNVVTDSFGYVYFTGVFSAVSIVFETNQLSANYCQGLFVIKLSPEGQVILKKSLFHGEND
jgi:hypothetical protein